MNKTNLDVGLANGKKSDNKNSFKTTNPQKTNNNSTGDPSDSEEKARKEKNNNNGSTAKITMSKETPTVPPPLNNLNDDKDNNFSLKSQSLEPRKKITLGRGFSLMDWIRFTKESVDLAGNQGVLKKVTYEELAKHNKEDDCWLAIYG